MISKAFNQTKITTGFHEIPEMDDLHQISESAKEHSIRPQSARNVASSIKKPESQISHRIPTQKSIEEIQRTDEDQMLRSYIYSKPIKTTKVSPEREPLDIKKIKFEGFEQKKTERPLKFEETMPPIKIEH